MRRLRPTRLLALGGLVVVGLLYWQPLNSYLHTREVLQRREAEVARLERQKKQLESRIESVDSSGMLVREARRLGLVKPGERLYIVRGISSWRKHN